MKSLGIYFARNILGSYLLKEYTTSLIRRKSCVAYNFLKKLIFFFLCIILHKRTGSSP